MEDRKDIMELFMEETYLHCGSEITKNFISANPINDEFSIILYPSTVYAADRFCSTDNEKFQYINKTLDQSFISFLERFDPLYKCTGFIEYHMYFYEGSNEDFIKHIKYQIIPLIRARKDKSDNKVDYNNLESIVSDWVQENSNLNSSEKEGVLDDIIGVSLSFLDSIVLYKAFKDENKYNTVITGLINQRLSNRSWTAKDQTLGGCSSSESIANRAGLAFRDIIICDNTNKHITAIECFRLYSIPKKQTIDSAINSHLTKIFANEPLGLSPLFIIVYCETKSFIKSWKKYLIYYSNIDFGTYGQKGIKDISEQKIQIANLKIGRSVHNREGVEVVVYHLFINMYP